MPIVLQYCLMQHQYYWNYTIVNDRERVAAWSSDTLCGHGNATWYSYVKHDFWLSNYINSFSPKVCMLSSMTHTPPSRLNLWCHGAYFNRGVQKDNFPHCWEVATTLQADPVLAEMQGEPFRSCAQPSCASRCQFQRLPTSVMTIHSTPTVYINVGDSW